MKIILVAIIFLVLLASPPSPRAQGAETVEGDIVHAQYNLDSLSALILQALDPLPPLQRLVGLLFLRIWSTSEQFDVADMSFYSNVYGKAFDKLNYHILFDSLKKPDAKFDQTITGRLCMGDDSVVSTEAIFSGDIPPHRELDWLTRDFNWKFNTKAPEKNNDYRVPGEVVSLGSANQCGSNDSGTTNTPDQVGGQNCNAFLTSGCDQSTGENKKTDEYAYVLFTPRNARAEYRAFQSIGGPKDYFYASPYGEDVQNYLAGRGGVFETMIWSSFEKHPPVQDKSNINLTRSNSFTTSAGQTQSINTREYLEFITKRGGDMALCASSFSVNQDSLPNTQYNCYYPPSKDTPTPAPTIPELTPTRPAVPSYPYPTLPPPPRPTPPPIPTGPASAAGWAECSTYFPVGSYFDLVNSGTIPPMDSNVTSLNYTLPWNNPSCQLNLTRDVAGICAMYWGLGGWANGSAGQANFRSLWDEVQAAAAAAGINPALVLALWAKESGAGSQPGGMGAWSLPSDYRSQINAIVNTISNQGINSFQQFMCQWSESTTGCSSFPTNPTFPEGIRWWYQMLTMNMPPECQITPQ